MQRQYTLEPIARIQTDFPEKFGIPRQSGLVEALEGRIVFEPAYRAPEALRGLEGFSHIWLIWAFSHAGHQGWSPTVRPPRLGGNARMGVFATRSPFRPNGLGLSCVRLAGIGQAEGLGPVLYVRGADLMDGTPIFDIKPYLPHADCYPEAAGGFAAPHAADGLEVDFPPELLERVPCGKQDALLGVLAQDPRPAYQQDGERLYGLSFAGLEVRFRVQGGRLTVTEVQPEGGTHR